MYNRAQLAVRYCHYFCSASNGNGHGIHSPFVFDFIKNVLNDTRNFYVYSTIENIRSSLLQNKTIIPITDFGAGSVTGAATERSIRQIAQRAAKPKKWGQLLFRMANYYQPTNILELGTSFGISAAYLAAGNTSATVTTLEGSALIAEVATQNFEKLSLNNITQIVGPFDEVLPTWLATTTPVDMVFVDGNHRKQPTLRYFNQLLSKKKPTSIFVFDDIHWSAEMQAAWKEIKAHPEVVLTIDLFFVGLVFFNTDFMVKQHFTIRF